MCKSSCVHCIVFGPAGPPPVDELRGKLSAIYEEHQTHKIPDKGCVWCSFTVKAK